MIWHEPYFVSNDGQTVAVLAWRFIQNDSIDTSHCVEFWSASGLLKAHAFSDLCPNPAKTSLVGIGPIGGFWRTWYTDAALEDSQLKVRTTGWRAYTFDMASGQVTESHILLGNLRYKPLAWVLGAALLIIGGAATVRRIRRGKRSTQHHASTAT